VADSPSTRSDGRQRRRKSCLEKEVCLQVLQDLGKHETKCLLRRCGNAKLDAVKPRCWLVGMLLDQLPRPPLLTTKRRLVGLNVLANLLNVSKMLLRMGRLHRQNAVGKVSLVVRKLTTV